MNINHLFLFYLDGKLKPARIELPTRIELVDDGIMCPIIDTFIYNPINRTGKYYFYDAFYHWGDVSIEWLIIQ